MCVAAPSVPASSGVGASKAWSRASSIIVAFAAMTSSTLAIVVRTSSARASDDDEMNFDRRVGRRDLGFPYVRTFMCVCAFGGRSLDVCMG